MTAKLRKVAYPPIVPDRKEWPIVKLGNHRVQFLAKVIDESFHRIKDAKENPVALKEEIETTHHKEKLRITTRPWKVDPEDDILFWENIKSELVPILDDKEGSEKLDIILRSIIERYGNEISSDFKPSYYEFAKRVVTFGFARLLNASRFKTLGGIIKNEYQLSDKINLVGHIDRLRSLAKKGTIVMVPTHFSNLDSILIGWVIETLGLPPFIYGAGLNLFNMSIFAYFMNSLGAFKVDRRKKNMIYLETLKTYSSNALREGIHSLFFPGGTRSRSGTIEKELKYGLLSTTIEAQRILYEEYGADTNRKIFIVPVVINYNFVLEAPSLINEYLLRKGQERYYVEEDEYSQSSKILKFLIKFFTKGSNISVSIGRSMDILGNLVDDEGVSLDQHGRPVDTSDYFKCNDKITYNKQREAEYTRMLAERIVEEYHVSNRVFASHLVAFAAFELICKQYPKLDLYSILRLPEEDIEIEWGLFRFTMERLRNKVLQLKEENKVDCSSQMYESIDHMIDHGVKNVGMYHVKKVLFFNKQGNIQTEDLKLLYFYRNRSEGYGFEKEI